MKNFNIMGSFTKNQYIWRNASKGDEQFTDLKVAWQRRWGVVFEDVVDTPMHTMKLLLPF